MTKTMTKKEMLAQAKQALRLASWYRAQATSEFYTFDGWAEAQHATLVLKARELIATVRRKVWAEKLARKVGAFPKAVGYHSLLLTTGDINANTQG